MTNTVLIDSPSPVEEEARSTIQDSEDMATYQILYWRDIPAQVRARDANGRTSVPLPARFQEAIDSAAMAAGLIGSDEYLDAFAWGEEQAREGTAAEVAAAVAAELDAQYPVVDWRDLRQRNG
jgi:hypothetical protein